MDCSKIVLICVLLIVIFLVINHKFTNIYEKKTNITNIDLKDAINNEKNKYGKMKKYIEGEYHIYEYNYSTITSQLKQELDMMLCDIIQNLNKSTNSKHFVSGYENVTKNIDKNKNNILYKITFFICEQTKLIKKKIYIEIYYNIESRLRHINEFKYMNSIPSIIGHSSNKLHINTETKMTVKLGNIHELDGLDKKLLRKYSSAYLGKKNLENSYKCYGHSIPCKNRTNCWDLKGILQSK